LFKSIFSAPVFQTGFVRQFYSALPWAPPLRGRRSKSSSIVPDRSRRSGQDWCLKPLGHASEVTTSVHRLSRVWLAFSVPASRPANQSASRPAAAGSRGRALSLFALPTSSLTH
jgi:hypothetical protein